MNLHERLSFNKYFFSWHSKIPAFQRFNSAWSAKKIIFFATFPVRRLKLSSKILFSVEMIAWYITSCIKYVIFHMLFGAYSIPIYMPAMLVTDIVDKIFAILVTNIHYIFTLASGTNIQKMSNIEILSQNRYSIAVISLNRYLLRSKTLYENRANPFIGILVTPTPTRFKWSVYRSVDGQFQTRKRRSFSNVSLVPSIKGN